MATTDYVDSVSACPCGSGTLTVTQASPDHPWVRASQVSYTARIDCDICRKRFSVQEGHSTFPHLVETTSLSRYREAKQTRKDLEAQICASTEAAQLQIRLASEIDAQTSMAARHRLMQRYGIAHESLGTFRKRPYGGETAVKHAGGHTLARIGSRLPASDPLHNYFREKAEALDLAISIEERLRPTPVKTGARWLSH